MEKVLAEEDCKPTKVRVLKGVYKCVRLLGRRRNHRKESKRKFGKLTAGLAVSPVAVEEVEMGESGAIAGSAEDPEEPTEVQRPRVAKSVATPTAQELEEHQATAHAVHRSWCGHCMRA